jgi:hypothetical protein
MANKRRPRKMRPPYRRYGPGVVKQVADEENEEDEEEIDAETSSLVVKRFGELSLSDSSSSLASSSSSASSSRVFSPLPSKDSSTERFVLPDPSRKSIYLPPEIIDMIISKISGPVSNDLLFVSHLWYAAAIKYTYMSPILDVNNYSKFVDTISNSDSLGPLVKILDLRNIIQSGKNSYTARLLRRCAPSLEVFIAPQTSFGYSPLVSLRQCHRLHTLDLSLVSETVDLRELFLAIRNLKELKRLEFPRSSVFCQQYDNIWPSAIEYLGLAGGISNDFVTETTFPHTIRHLSISHCPFINSESVRLLAGKIGQHLTSLKVLYPLPALRPNTLDSILFLCPKLEVLTASVDYISRYVFARPNLPTDEMGRIITHPLKNLTLDSSGMLGQTRKINADDISLAILEDKLPNLRFVRISNKIGWNPQNEDMSELVEVLEERNGGVWMF